MISLLSVMAVIQIHENSLNSVFSYTLGDAVGFPLLLEIKFLTSEVSISKNYLLTFLLTTLIVMNQIYFQRYLGLCTITMPFDYFSED